ncbi:MULTISPECIES: esterase [Oceanobacillus]|uniref:Esterase n=2 Tax=Oceanobacillus TaxID=182709 RepID=A0A0A1N0T3_9BACI|nr:esterase [Oceanobacillus oncorhynchi]MDM8102428.1 esterase [Oceanobacillus oncorhynchi]CEI84566.1 esterase [Oceanobacillus oncorhynchi]
MIGIYQEPIEGIPCLHVVDQKYAGGERPTVIYYHGFTSAKEQNLPIAYMLAEKGFRVLLPEALHHGERNSGLSDDKRQLAFFEIVLKNIRELDIIRKYLLENKLLKENALGVAGTSMGGITTSAALVKYSWVNAAAVMMGTPKLQAYAHQLLQYAEKNGKTPFTQEDLDDLFEQLAELDLSAHVESLHERPLMFWHGENDKVVPYEQSHSFYQTVKQAYKKKDHLQFIGEKGREHKVSVPAMHHAAEWFERHLL